MSKYTTEVRFICEQFSGLSESAEYSDVEQVIKKCLPKVFDFQFPIFDESYRSIIETKILRHYYTREIGLETVGLWKLKLNTKLNEIMPYYNKLYKSELIEFNPLYDVELTRERKRYTRLEMRKQACKKINEMFGLNIDVKYRADIQSFTSEDMGECVNETDVDNGGENNE